ncbi:MAG TPA: hypothetical protein PK453_21225 [Leptospiraceae bacterium]|nr:hypothetical protein [Leptospiraceae bacterium]HNF16197.1 hypothetical protein [Leptospiraceae bacterium]HNI96161.1 hypothetical protein [Leptospiraceae bacterium]HNM06232.1 hypothetical protein [Leptospiraceae bacterium]HNN04204.1 hypothetical protein [Leptospiraceae bacterium]
MIKIIINIITVLLVLQNCRTADSGIRENQPKGQNSTEALSSSPKSKKDFLQKIDSSAGETKAQSRMDYAVFLESVNQFDDGVEQINLIIKENPGLKHWQLTDIAYKLGMWKGHQETVSRNYAKALDWYNWAYSFRKNDPKNKENWTLENLIDASSGALKTPLKKDAAVHRCAGVFIDKVSIHETSDGKRYDIENASTPIMKERQILFQSVLRMIIERVTEGGMTLEFRNFDTDSIQLSLKGTDNLKPPLGELFQKLTKEFDSIFPYFDGTGFTGGSWGGGTNYPIITEHYYSHLRGFVQHSASWVDSSAYQVLYHEFFHSIEDIAGITPKHGFFPENRKHFPGWKGRDEYDYFKWHFETGLRKKPWTELNYLKNQKNEEVWPDEFTSRVRSRLDALPYQNKKESGLLVRKGLEIWNQKKDELSASRLMNEALTKNPYRFEALKFLADRAYDKKEYSKAMKYYSQYNDIYYDPNIYLHIGHHYMWVVNDRAKAEEAYLSYLKQFPKTKEEGKFQVYLARVYEEMKDYSNAKKYYEKAYKENQDNAAVPQGCFRLAYILNEVDGNKSEAKKWLDISIQKGYGTEAVEYKKRAGL